MKHHLFICALLVAGQTTAPPAAPPIKTTPASEALIRAAKDYYAEKASFDNSLQQARTALEGEQQSLQKQVNDLQRQLNDQLQVDKKYKPLMDKIRELQKQSNDLQAAANQKFNATAGPVQSKMNSDKALMEGLVPIVRKENDFPDTATFDPATQTWRK